MISVAAFGEILNSHNFPKNLPKVLAKFSTIFRLLPELFPFPQKICWEITYTGTMPSDVFIFVNILKLQFLPSCWISWQNFGRIQSFPEILAKFSGPQH